MSTRSNLNHELNSERQQSIGRIVAFFAKREDACHALSKLKQAGFRSDRIGLALAHELRTDREYDSSWWQKIKDFFSGEEHHEEAAKLQDVSTPMGWTDERYKYYEQGLAAGGALVTVSGERLNEAREILRGSGADLRETGFQVSASGAAGTAATQGMQRIQLRGEMLHTYKERVKRGEVRLRKEVVTENQTVQVPVTREELVMERTPASGQPASGEVKGGDEIRVPLTEERVRVEKQPVVTEEVRVGKREIPTNQQVSDKVKHEELRVEKEGNVQPDETKPRGDKKDRAA